ncbi:DUF4365 domain-containing protein [Flavobacterium taihuense]|uniref:DUF4365 domain-containing protein n=1 Tax=Flavobacterium taihuense TaxID=2857508 RepID=A0ABS6XVI3_9FLAO|nr:DUF4365 domain-containing protein [Flavobacterium taihuense]MBW4360666.1 DUF4365 domain-containing protein [Flavobacterium taihuense]
MKKDNNYIRKEADDLLKGNLRELFFQNNMNLKEHSASAGEDNGTDFYFDVTSENEEHNFFFRNQNKGTYDDLVIIKNNNDENFAKISYQISLRNVSNYYYEFDEAMIFTICDLNSNNIYWYDIQNDYSLKERILNQKSNNVKSIQIYIPTENVLNENTLKDFIDKIHYSKYIQLRKKKYISGNLEADYSKIEVDIRGKHIIDKIHYVIKLFEGIAVLPTDVISQLPPFKGKENNTFINRSTLNTESEDFFDFIESIILENDELKLKSNEVLIDNQKEKLKDIIDFLQVNMIHHIVWRGKQPKMRICVHKLFEYKKCDCERCNLERLDFKKTNILLGKDLENNTVYERLRRGYTHYLLGDYKKSVELFLEIYNDSTKTNNPITYTISTYNLTKLKRLIKSSYYGDDENQILEQLNPIKFDIDEPFINSKAPYFLEVFRDIKEKRFYEIVRDEIENCYDEIQKISFNDKYGISYSHNKYEDLKYSFLRFTNYLEHNFIIFNHYAEFKLLSKKVLESVFALYTLKNIHTEKHEKFSWSVIEMWIFNVDEDSTKHLLKKYSINKIKIDETLNIISRINELVENLIQSNEYLDDLSSWNKPLKVDTILNQILLITSLLNVDYSDKDKILLNVIELCEVLQSKNKIPYNQLIKFVENNEDEISKERIKQILDLFFNDENQKYNFGRAINIYAEKSTKTEIEEFIKRLLKINDLDEIDINLEDKYLKKLFYSFTFLDKDFTDRFIQKIINNLNEKFDRELYNFLSIYGFIGYDEDLFKKYVSSVPNYSNIDNDSRHYFLSYENLELGSVINLIYKYNLEITEELKKLSNKSHKKYFDYYCWLLDIDNFDYSKFNSHWILEYRTIHYFERFKKSEKLKSEIMKSLKSDYIEGVSKLFFEIYT